MICSRSPSELEAVLGWTGVCLAPDSCPFSTPKFPSSPSRLPFPMQVASADLRTCKPGDTRSVTSGWSEGSTWDQVTNSRGR